MVRSIKLSVVMPLVESWNLMKLLNPDWKSAVGISLFEKLLQASPLSFWILIPFAHTNDENKLIIEKDGDDEEMEALVTETMSVIDFIVGGLGAEMDTIHMQLAEIIQNNMSEFQRVRPEHWVIFVKAFLESLQESLGDQPMDANTLKCWEMACEAISQMIVNEIMPK